MSRFEIEAPNGQILEIEGDTPPSEQELDNIFNSMGANQPQQTLEMPQEDINPQNVLQGQVQKTNFVGDLGKGLVQGVSKLGVGMGKNIINPLREKIGKQPLTEQQLNQAYGFLDDEPTNFANGLGQLTGNILPYLALPELKAGELTVPLTGLYQGATIGLTDSLADKGLNLGENTKDTITGGLLGGLINVGLSGAKNIGRIAKRLPKGALETYGLGKGTFDRMMTSPRGTIISENAEEIASPEFINTISNNVRNGIDTLQNNAVKELSETVENLIEQNIDKTASLKDSVKKAFESLNKKGLINKDGTISDFGEETEGLSKFIEHLSKNNRDLNPQELQWFKTYVLDNIIDYGKNGETLTNNTRALQNIAKSFRKDVNDKLGDILGDEYRQANKKFADMKTFLSNPDIKNITNTESIDTLGTKLKKAGTTNLELRKNLQKLEQMLNENGIVISDYTLVDDILDYLSAKEINDRIRTGLGAGLMQVARRGLVQPIAETGVNVAKSNTVNRIANNVKKAREKMPKSAKKGLNVLKNQVGKPNIYESLIIPNMD